MLVTITGTQPLLMNNVQSADPRNEFARAIKEITSKRKKTDADLDELYRLKFMASLYYDDTVGPYLPAPNLFRALIEAGTITRSGKKVERGVVFLSRFAPLEYDGKRDIASLWGDGATRFVDRRMVTVNRKKVVGVRAIFPDWSAAFPIEVDDSIIDPAEFLEIAACAGKIGVGDYRRFYGKFTVEVTE